VIHHDFRVDHDFLLCNDRFHYNTFPGGRAPNDLPLSELPILEMFLDGNIGNVTQRQPRHRGLGRISLSSRPPRPPRQALTALLLSTASDESLVHYESN